MTKNKSVNELMDEVDNDPRLTEKIDELTTLYNQIIEEKGILTHPDYDNYVKERSIEYEDEGGSQDTMLSITGALWFNN